MFLQKTLLVKNLLGQKHLLGQNFCFVEMLVCDLTATQFVADNDKIIIFHQEKQEIQEIGQQIQGK